MCLFTICTQTEPSGQFWFRSGKKAVHFLGSVLENDGKLLVLNTFLAMYKSLNYIIYLFLSGDESGERSLSEPSILVTIVPEKKGIFLKHSEYEVRYIVKYLG